MGMFQKIKAYLNEDDAEYDALIEEQERMREERRKRRNQSRAERNQEQAKRAAEKAVLKERVDPEIRREVKETVSSNRERKTVGDFCEQLVDTKYHMEDMKQEYKLVTDYLVDIQRIEELPVNLAEDIIDTALAMYLLVYVWIRSIRSKRILLSTKRTIFLASNAR